MWQSAMLSSGFADRLSDGILCVEFKEGNRDFLHLEYLVL